VKYRHRSQKRSEQETKSSANVEEKDTEIARKKGHRKNEAGPAGDSNPSQYMSIRAQYRAFGSVRELGAVEKGGDRELTVEGSKRENADTQESQV